jgi:hypothetical protein
MSTTLYLGTIGTSPELASLASYAGKKEKPAVLMSFHFLPQIRKTSEELFRTVKSFGCMLDSGAYSARRMKKEIDIEALIVEVKSGGWKEAAALDSIGDPETSYRNAMHMAEKGADAFPTFHYGEPWEYLRKYAAMAGKVGLGGLVPVKSSSDRDAWLSECFSRIWPKKTHGFGVMGEDTLMKFPFHSVDSTSWEAGALCFGNYQFAAGQKLGMGRPKARAAVGGLETYLRPEVAWYMRLEKMVQARWAPEFRRQGWV